MPYLTQLADVARRTGHPVTEVGGWRQRGHGPQPAVRGVVAHHTAGPSAGGDYPSLKVVRDGRPGLEGPLSHFGLGRSGRIYVIAAGRCWHNAPSTSQAHTNSNALGIEAENNGSQSWPEAQLSAYKRLCGELCREFGLAASAVKGHKEVNTQKPDPHTLNMGDFRADVDRVITGEELDDGMVPDHARYQGRNLDLIVPPGEWRFVPFTLHNSDPLEETYYSVVFKRSQYFASVAVRFANAEGKGYEPLKKLDEVQVRLVEVEPVNGNWELTETAPINSPVHVAGGGHFTYTWNGNCQKNRRVRFQVTQFGEAPALIDWTDASVHTFPY